jgi:xylulokinase
MPNWQDSSTTAECREIEAAVGGADALARITGSKAHERFTGPQIMRFKKIDPEAYDNTHRISLCSSFITTMLCLDGAVKGIDESDACGMNLWTMNDEGRGWNEEVLEAIAGEAGAEELNRKLGQVETDGGRVVGQIGDWYVQRYGFSPDCCVFPGTGDNPATFLSLTRECYRYYAVPVTDDNSSTIRGIGLAGHIGRRAGFHIELQPSPRVPRLLPPGHDRSSKHPGQRAEARC